MLELLGYDGIVIGFIEILSSRNIQHYIKHKVPLCTSTFVSPDSQSIFQMDILIKRYSTCEDALHKIHEVISR